MKVYRTMWKLLACVSLATAVFSAAASGAAAPPHLKVGLFAPDYVTPGEGIVMFVNIQNVGDQPLEGSLTLDATFPDGMAPEPFEAHNGPVPQCQTSGQEVECTIDVTGVEAGTQLRYKTYPAVEPTASGRLDGGMVRVSGGGSGEAFEEPLAFTAGPVGPFAIKDLTMSVSPGPVFPADQAGSTPPELSSHFSLYSEARSTFNLPFPAARIVAPPEHMREVVAHIPAGLVGDPSSTPLRCTAAQLTSFYVTDDEQGRGVPNCPDQSQVGLVQLNSGDIVGLFNLVPPPRSPAAFGFFYNSIVVTLLPRLRPADNGIDLVVPLTDDSIPLPQTEVTFWGSPGDRSHDPLRGVCIYGGGGHSSTEGDCSLKNRSGRAFLRTPTSCPATPLPWSIEMDTYEHPGSFVSKATTTPAMQGCNQLPFDPSLALAPSERSAGSPSGLDLSLTMPQERSPGGLAEADMRSVDLELPQGVAINSASADGLAACTDVQLRLGLEGPSQCPDAAKIGTLDLKSPLLEEAISGSVYLRSQASNDPASGDLFRVALEIRSDERGVDVKLPGSLKVDPNTGRLSTSFQNLPQLPFESMQLHLKTGPRAPLTTPQTCGTYTAHARLEGWNGKVDEIDPTFTIDQDCTSPPFAPGFEAGVSNATAGRFAPFTLRVTRDSGQPNVSRIDATLPEGELAKLAGVPVCGDVQAAAGTCPAASRIGQVTAGIGEGSSPLFLPQQGKEPTALYLAGPYKGGPYSVVAKVPAQAGPFDLGQVRVRSALHIDPETTRVTVASDPLPQIFQGVPVSYRDVRVEVDRPGFTINPTDCEPTATSGAIASATGATAKVSDRFQVGDCASLGFRPKLAISLKGKTGRSGHPALMAVLLMPTKGANANIARASVSLPHSEFLAQGHIKTICTRVQYAAGAGGGAQCPKGSVYGHATAWSPLLDRPLSGPVYLRSSNNPLPDLVASLGGQIQVDLDGRIDSDPKTGGLRTTFDQVPDAPVSKFVLKMPGGKKSLLENSTDICRGKHRAVVKMVGQNGRDLNSRPLVKAKCGKGARSR